MGVMHRVWLSCAGLAAVGCFAGCASGNENGNDDIGGLSGCPVGTALQNGVCAPIPAAGAAAGAASAGLAAAGLPGAGLGAAATGGTAIAAGSGVAAGDTALAGTGMAAGVGAAGTIAMAGAGAIAGDTATAGTGMAAGTGATAGTSASGSTGCGSASPPADGMQTIDVDGLSREFIVKLPAGYDPSTPHKLVFAWHGLGGTASRIALRGYYGLESRAGGSTIFVAGQGLATSNSVGSGPGWDNMGGRDVAFTRTLLEWLRTSYCIDDARIFSVGMSYGGIMSNTIGCALGAELRAIAPMAGSGPYAFGGPNCTGQVAVWITHGNTDTVVTFSSGERSRDHWTTANNCASTSTPVGSDGCVAYDGCDDGYPVHWCEFSGGHIVPGFAADNVWSFFSQF